MDDGAVFPGEIMVNCQSVEESRRRS